MRRTLTIALGSAVALVTAAVAFAVVPSAVGVSETTATFTAEHAVNVEDPHVCTDPYSRSPTVATRAGRSTFADAALRSRRAAHIPALAQPSTPRPASGTSRARSASRTTTAAFSGRFSGTLKGGNFVGFLDGQSRGNHAKVLGNLSATVRRGHRVRRGSARLGKLEQRARCGRRPGLQEADDQKRTATRTPAAPLSRARPDHLDAGNGSDPGTVTVTSKKGPTTCAIDGKGSTLGTGLAVGTKVEMKCGRSAIRPS